MRGRMLRYCCCNALFALVTAHPFGVLTTSELNWRGSTVNVQTYKTEPNFNSLTFDVLRRTSDESLLDPGYLFMTGTIVKHNIASGGAQIFDDKGNLIWLGDNERAQDLKVSDYLGQEGTHLSVYSQEDKLSYFLDQSYSRLPGVFHGPNGHEFRVMPGGERVLRIDGKIRSIGFQPYTGEKTGYVLDTCLIEVDVRTAKEIFRWCPLDHIPVWQTTAYFPSDCFDHQMPLLKTNESMRSSKAGCTTEHHPWDWSHGNAVDKSDGDYLYCSRFLDQIIKVAGLDNRHGVKPGTILWRLGGAHSDFQQNFNFSRQHHVRYLSITKTETVISLFNNAWEGTNKPSSDSSEGQIIRINNETMKAELVNRYTHPEKLLSEGRGSTQTLPNGNVLVGYGRMPDIVEHASNGTVLLHARFSENPFKMTDQLDIRELDFSYRVFKFPWVGKPKYPPKLLAYSLSCTTSKISPLIAYVSWNGATQVVAWRFYVSSTTDTGPWLPAGQFQKQGFETLVHLSNKAEAKLLGFTPYVKVEGISATGEVLGTQLAQTFVPKRKLKNHCDMLGCNSPEPFTYDFSDARTCKQGSLIPGYINLGLLVVLLEICYYCCRVIPGRLLDFRSREYTQVVETTECSDNVHRENNDNDLKSKEDENEY